MLVKIKDLSQGPWKFREKGKKKWYPAKVPGCVHTDLFLNNLIPDPFFGLNEKKIQWIEKKDWEYELVFESPGNLNEYDACYLRFNGLDTYASIYLNNELIITADNMFIPFETEVGSKLTGSKNKLRVQLKSPYNSAVEDYNAADFPLPANNDEGELKVSPYTRKSPYMYGWDWGPRLLTSGIWKTVELIMVRDARILYAGCSPGKISKKRATMNLEYELDILKPGNYWVTCKIDGEEYFRKKTEFYPSKTRKKKKIKIKKPELWWPRGYGDQKLYNFELRLENSSGIVDTHSITAGIRSIELVREKDVMGNSFRFRINGKNIFMRGANIIPLHYFPSEIKDENYRELIDNALSVNMNMLRAWGGGLYEGDAFYQYCDKNGILVWQDFMFSCGMYPSGERFLNNVGKEIRYQVKRLKKHPSVILWCGNNEILEGYLTWGWKDELGSEHEKAFRSYRKLFHEYISGIVEEHDRSRPYWPSSPSSESGSAPDLFSGDYHYWDLVKDIKPFTVYAENTGRFMSEYGFKAYPELRTISSYIEPEDWDIRSEAMEEHQGWPTGIELVEKNLEWFYPRPANFQYFLYLSQLLQAAAIAFAIENHRKSKPHCMGTLYWQMNDCWPAASWSGIDYFGRWKALHYRLKRVFKDILITAEEVQGELKIHAISDLPELQTLRVYLRIIDFDGNLIAEHNSMEDFDPEISRVIYHQKITDFINPDEKNKAVLIMNAYEGDHQLSYNLHYFVPPKDLILEDPEISMHVEKKFNKVFLFLKAEKLAKNIYLVNSVTDGFFSDNYFDMLPGEDKIVVFEAKEERGLSLEDFRLMSLWNCFFPVTD